ncbi:MAG: glycosyltransferase family 39 protein [Caldilineaceae bacterium]|nr:glycosyltransferase family 39 protein [Caldilineaceae bacterium]
MMTQRSSAERVEQDVPVTALLRGLLLCLMLIAFARLTWQLDAKNLWWDESLSLQRAEEDWLSLLRGTLVLQDGVTTQPTTDQHPFAFFLLLGGLIRLAGISEYTLRWPSVAAATLLVPTAWVFGARLVKNGIAAPSMPYWAALFAALSPFFLWYGQEARPYALWAWLALLSTYLLVRATAPNAPRSRWLGYGLALFFYLTSQYYAVFLLPVHALILYQWDAQRNRRRALMVAAALMIGGALVAAIGAWLILGQAGGGSNFRSISPGVLFPDLLNAFSLGLSVDIVRVWWIDLLFGLVALAGLLWGMRTRAIILRGGWIVPACVMAPILLLLLADAVRPAYMNARHLSLIGGFFILLLGSGMGLIWQRQRWMAAGLAVLLVAAMGYSTRNYFMESAYAKPDYEALGESLSQRLHAGDLVLLNSPLLWRIYQYYLPTEQIEALADAGAPVQWRGIPLLGRPVQETFSEIDQWTDEFQRIWVVRSGVNAFLDPDGEIEPWLDEHLFKVREFDFFNPTSGLETKLYLPEPPVDEDQAPILADDVNAIFGDQIELAGYFVGRPLTNDSTTPVTLYWDPQQTIDRRYKYVLQLEMADEAGTWQRVAVTEREPYDGYLPTIWWSPGPVIYEYSELNIPHDVIHADDDLRLTLQLYDADTLEKLPITAPGNGLVAEDGTTLIMPVELTPPYDQALQQTQS